MIQTGRILKIEGRRVVVFTEQCDIVCIEKQPGMYVGLKIRFSSSEIINKRNMFIQYSPSLVVLQLFLSSHSYCLILCT